MKMRTFLLIAIALLSSGHDIHRVSPASLVRVTEPPGSLKTRSFYKKYVSCKGLPILSSEKVPDAALVWANTLINQMLADRPDIRKALIEADVRFVVIGAKEQTTDVPEYSHLKPKEFWDQRARGLGGRVVSCGEENLLCYPVDRYDDENILIHEFAHTIHGIALKRIDKEFDQKLKRLYEQALVKGLWKGTYAGSNRSEYWAEAVQSYFDANRQNNYNHNHVNTREELQAYDPDLARLVAEVFRHSKKTDWRYKPLAKQPQVTTPPASLRCDSFYKKYVRAKGLPIIGSERICDEALLEADYLVRHMFTYRHDILKAMIDAGVRFVVIGANEKVADLPEFKDVTVGHDGDRPVRIVHCTPERPIIGCGEENLLGYPADCHAGECMLIREFAHALYIITGRRPIEPEYTNRRKQQYELGLRRIDQEFNDRLKRLYEKALKKGLWKNTYAAKSCGQYWSEAVQSWFDANRQNDYGHNHVNSREELHAYDPDLADLVAEVFRHAHRNDWRYKCPADR
jgi:hypothetical protein